MVYIYNDLIKIDTFHVQHFSVWSNFNKVQRNVPYFIRKFMHPFIHKFEIYERFQSEILHIRLQLGQL